MTKRLPCMTWHFFLLLGLTVAMSFLGVQTQVNLCFTSSGFALGLATALWINAYARLNT